MSRVLYCRAPQMKVWLTAVASDFHRSSRNVLRQFYRQEFPKLSQNLRRGFLWSGEVILANVIYHAMHGTRCGSRLVLSGVKGL